MKRYILSLFAIGFFLGIVGCKEEVIDTYSGDNGIYFDTYNEAKTGSVSDTIKVHWGTLNTSVVEMTQSLKVVLFGHTAPYDRHFSVAITPVESNDEMAAVAGVDYQDLSSSDVVMPANSAEAVIDIKLLRRAGLADMPRRFKVSLQESDELKLLYTRYKDVIIPTGEETADTIRVTQDYHRVIYMDENFGKPSWWTSSASNAGFKNFGAWSVLKAALICDVMGIDRVEWMDSKYAVNHGGYLTFCGKYMQKYLNEKKAEGNTIYEADGVTEMVMGKAAQ